MSCVIVTGGCGRLGRRWYKAIERSDRRAYVVDPKLTDPLFTEIGWAGYTLSFIGAFPDIIEDIEDTLGPVTGLVNAAAYNPPPDDNYLDGWNTQLETLDDTKTLMEFMGSYWKSKERKNCSIVNIGSDLSLIAPDPTLYRDTGNEMKDAGYTTVKHALVGLTKHYAVLWAKDGIRVNLLCPGPVGEDMDPDFEKELVKRIPMGRTAEPTEYDDAIIFLLSDASKYMTGATLVMDGGRTAW
jgi:NAD(P)-dependent dehydrogenase (short-subunit alcohol dehydrogenase family)